MHRETIIVGNWKMHKTIQESIAFVKHLVASLPLSGTNSHFLGLAVPFTALSPLRALLSPFHIGAQNISEFPEGAYTGEISATMVREAGADFTLIGHSERRRLFGEGPQIPQKLREALRLGLRPLLCIGETAAERKERKTTHVLQAQLHAALETFKTHELKTLMVAYEPIWAIGTGVVATPQQVEETHSGLRKILSEYGEKIPLLYGGSVKPDSAQSLLTQKEVDGLLVGGASLDPHHFAQIISQGIK